MDQNVMVCCTPPAPVPVPLNRMLCAVYAGAVALRALSVNATMPLNMPAAVGAKLMGNRQDCPAASLPTVEEPALTSWHEDVPLLFKAKFVEMLGLFPIFGTGKFSAALPC